jgi:hypothetical protein
MKAYHAVYDLAEQIYYKPTLKTKGILQCLLGSPVGPVRDLHLNNGADFTAGRSAHSSVDQQNAGWVGCDKSDKAGQGVWCVHVAIPVRSTSTFPERWAE